MSEPTVRPWADRRIQSVAVACISVGSFVAVRIATHASSFDLKVYRAEGHEVRVGGDLYGHLPHTGDALATYPPFAALLFTSLTVMPLLVAKILALVVNIAAVFGVVHLLNRIAAVRGRRVLRLPSAQSTLVLGAVALWSEPVLTTLRYGQINLLLLLLVLADVLRWTRGRTAGIGVGLAAGLKVTPAVFIVYLVLTGRTRSAMVATATAAATIGVSALLLPHETLRFWTRLLFDTDRVGRTDDPANQTLRGVAARIEHAGAAAPWATLVIVGVAVLGVVATVLAHRHLDELWSVSVCAVAALMCAPIAWSHHWVWCLPAAFVLCLHAPRWAWLAAPFWTYAMWVVPHRQLSPEPLLDPGQNVLAAAYSLAGTALVLLTIHRGLTARRSNRSNSRSEREDAVDSEGVRPPFRQPS